MRLVRWGAAIYFVLFLAFVTWPGFIPFNRPLPLVLGLPFNMAFIALWVGASALVLFVVDRSEHGSGGENRARHEHGSGGEGRARDGSGRKGSASAARRGRTSGKDGVR